MFIRVIYATASYTQFYITEKLDIAVYTNCTTDDVDTSQILAVLSADAVRICRLSGLTHTCRNTILLTVLTNKVH